MNRIWLVIVIAVVAYAYLLTNELHAKREWSALQAAEAAFVNSRQHGRITFMPQKDIGVAIGIVASNGRSRSWILNKSAIGQQIKILPAPDIKGINAVRLAPDEFELIIKETEISDDVRTFLLNSIEPSMR